ncbi:MAG: hypothetical protein H8D23_26550 [Candidatus Brocadiales bacterium]|nr:hypothetical protein [Candidatus Brocadiales bacterium]
MKTIVDTLAAHPSIALSSTVTAIGFKALMFEWVYLVFMIVSIILGIGTILGWMPKIYKCIKKQWRKYG